jgi:hypothetical protein
VLWPVLFSIIDLKGTEGFLRRDEFAFLSTPSFLWCKCISLAISHCAFPVIYDSYLRPVREVLSTSAIFEQLMRFS